MGRVGRHPVIALQCEAAAHDVPGSKQAGGQRGATMRNGSGMRPNMARATVAVAARKAAITRAAVACPPASHGMVNLP